MMPATPYLLTAFLNTFNNSNNDVTKSSRRLMSTGVRGMSTLTTSVEQSEKLHNTRKTHFYDQYEIISSGGGPGNNIARPHIISDHSRTTSKMYAMEETAVMEMTPALHPLRVELGDVVDVVVQGYASISGGCDLHPWHLHGHSFWLISRGEGLYGDTTGTTYVSEFPLRQDTVSGYPTNHSESRSETTTKGKWRDPCGWFKIRLIQVSVCFLFQSNTNKNVICNPKLSIFAGMWLFHCHIGWHMEMGMAVVFDEASELVSPPPADYGMCGAAGDYKTFTSFATNTIITNATTRTIVVEDPSGTSKHGEVFHVLTSFVVILGVVSMVALLWVYLSRRKVNGMFVTLDSSNGAGEGSVNTMNPLSTLHEAVGSEVDEESGAVQMVAFRPRTQAAHSNKYEACSADKEVDDELVEVCFVRAARSAVQKHQSDRSSGHKSNTKLSPDENSVFDDEAEHGGALHPARKPLTWKSSQGLKK